MAEEKVIIIKPRGNDIFIKEQQGKPVTIDPPKGGAVWGKLVGDINDQQDLIDLINSSHDHTIEDLPGIGKLLLTLNVNDPDESTHTQYLIARELYVAPSKPTYSLAAGSYNGTQSLTLTATGSTIYYTTDGSDPKTSNTRQTYSSAISLAQDTSVQTKSYTIKAVAQKNGLYSDVESKTYTIKRKVATPAISASGNDYASPRTITISCTTSGATIYYTTDGSTPTTSSSVYNSSSKPSISSSKTIKAIAVVDGTWANSSVASQTYTVGKKMCYIGQAASLADNDAVEDLANSYERDTMVGWTAPTINFGTTTQYVWFAIPNTAARNLTVKSEGFGVTLDNAAGTIVGGYRVWRTANKINSSFTFQFS